MTMAPPGVSPDVNGSPSWEDVVEDGRGARRVLAARAITCYARLSRMMHSLRWRQGVRTQGAWLREARELDMPVLELLAREQGRSLKGLRARRNRLEGLVRERLGRLTRSEPGSLVEGLNLLERVVNAPVPQPPGSGEPVLLEGTQRGRHVLTWPGMWVFALLAFAYRQELVRHGNPLPLLLAGGALWLLFSLRYTGRFWLTSKRLVWQPRFGEAVQVSLASIAEDGLRALPAWGEVRIQGDRKVTVRHARLAGRLAALVDLQRCAPFLGTADGTPQVNEVSVLPAWREPGHPQARAQQGVAVLRPGYAAFLPAHRAGEIFRGWVGPQALAPEADVTLELLVEHLRLLPDADFDAHLRQAVFSHGGELWLADEVHPHPAPGAGEVYRLRGRGRGMEMRPNGAQAEAAHRIVRQWAA